MLMCMQTHCVLWGPLKKKNKAVEGSHHAHMPMLRVMIKSCRSWVTSHKRTHACYLLQSRAYSLLTTLRIRVQKKKKKSLWIKEMDDRVNVTNAPFDVGVLRDDISLQRVNQVFVFPSSVEPLHLHLRGLGFVLEVEESEELHTLRRRQQQV